MTRRVLSLHRRSLMPTSPRAFLSVVYLLGAALLIGLAGVIVLAAQHTAVPDLLKEVTVGCLTGLAGLLARSPSDGTPVAVTVQQPESAPVPVVPVEPEPLPPQPRGYSPGEL